ncbi:uncharacterized protein LAESUDRAFT_10907 [Laetiporus sulphureus 93-53]|uniref:Uncharacterized protein n=1 Tax=Laetiporus sulphureus 93-53 TaxID=1314785 RepID=A0A165I6T5_9APHY|nr:uncharacterized protein LAESUDRAFT_10907 [Laetiporus sulphureus 93-53]KZT12670.1 hypothetical protein LAESUDRAFT_10907 [Laetiporus sulphureus 93-53]
MLCNWSTSANTLLRGVARGSPGLTTPWHASKAISTASILRSLRVREVPNPFTASYQTSAFLSTTALAKSATSTPSPHHVDPPPSEASQASTWDLSSVSLTAAQMSRATAQAVRLCARDGKFGDALYLINSVHSSTHRERQPLPEKENHLAPPRMHLEPINFGQAISPRLSAHSFLHSLIRAGYNKKAAAYAELMFEQGIRIRTHTLSSIVSSLTPSLTNSLNGSMLVNSIRRRPVETMGAPERSFLVADSCTQTAIKLLERARQWGQQRTERMYDNLISGCLMQGEIIVASLLFVLLVKDWQARKAPSEQPLQTEVAEEHPVSSSRLPRFPRFETMPPYPHPTLMISILHHISESFSSKTRENDGRDDYLQSLQSLADLAMLLDSGQLGDGRAMLFRLMYSCPKTKEKVWVQQSGKARVQVEAYRYFHDVLKRQIFSLADRHPPDPPPRLRLNAYNTLLSYALRHRLSPAMASKILEHMCVHRKPPLEPNITTYNILLRSGALLKKMDMSDMALCALRRSKVNADHGIMVEPPVSVTDDKESRTESDNMPKKVDMGDCDGNEHSRPSPSLPPPSRKALRRLYAEKFNVPRAMKNSTREIRANTSTLTSYIAHLTATGKPQAVADVLFFIMPELRIVDHPAWGALTRKERRMLLRESREASMQRAVELGPYAFSAILNALEKSGKMGLAERVWLLAKQAEAASWISHSSLHATGWYLPVHAYTSMLRCYANYSRKALSHIRQEREMAHALAGDGDRSWRPTVDNTKGWAAFVVATQKLLSRNIHGRRRKGSRGLHMLPYRYMSSGGWAVYRSLMDLHLQDKATANQAKRPSPDELFFNTALDLFGRHPQMRLRRSHRNRSHWKRRLRVAIIRYENNNWKPPLWTSRLQNLAQDMIATGYAVPPAFRPLFVGRWVPGTLDFGPSPAQRSGRPYAFPRPPKRFYSFTLATTKVRGLPLRRRYHRRKRDA